MDTDTKNSHKPVDARSVGVPRAGWRPREWRKAVGDMPNSTFYALSPQVKPHSVKLGKMRIITESPVMWLRRVGRTAA